MSQISLKEVKHVAKLARLSVTEEEAALLTKQLDDIISYAEQLNELDTDDVEATTHVLDLKNVLRDDVEKEWLTREEALKNTPDQQNGLIKVPAVLE